MSKRESPLWKALSNLINCYRGKAGSDGGALFAEAATCQLEYKYLAKLTGRKEFYDPVSGYLDIFRLFAA